MFSPDFIWDNLPAGLLVIDHQARIRIFNRTLANRTGLPAEQMIGQRYPEIYPGTNKLKLLEALYTGKVYDQIRAEEVLPVPHTSILAASCRPIITAGGTITGALALFTENAHLREMQQTVMKADRLAIMGQLAAQVVHEVKNPLTTIKGFLQLLKEESHNFPKQQEYLDIMLEAIDHANAIITDFLQLARPGCSCWKRYAPEKLLSEVCLLMESEAALRDITIRQVIPEVLPPVWIDPEQMKQVLVNIIKNSLEAMPEGGQVTIETSCRTQELLITISDTGMGMNELVLENIFEPFFTTKASGTGLGMFIAKQIVHKHQGDIKVESVPGKGTTVTISLPILHREGGMP
ncbi:two-component system sensor histidine kinase NtrB [Desulfofundulus salinus]|uniref:histidine kinase n=1 Tax=Desulfofundulus salinus TaxID=2419843 RepID=A0A494X0F5_9FIRM|nr:ATP-binding protein [Desulfofundulus salinum]RKO66677.1 PAS domain-containing protein [Desulfofundulus salinum]